MYPEDTAKKKKKAEIKNFPQNLTLEQCDYFRGGPHYYIDAGPSVLI